MEKSWKHFHHQADIGIFGKGSTPQQAFEQAAYALTAVMCNPDRVSGQTEVRISCSAPDLELLFIDWINEILFHVDTKQMLFSRFDVTINDHDLKASIFGERIDEQKHETAVAVKAATYMQLKVGRVKDGWFAQCVVDV